MICGWVRLSRSLLPCRAVGHSAEPFAAVAGLVRPVPLDRRAHRAVDHHDPLAQSSRQFIGAVGADVRLPDPWLKGVHVRSFRNGRRPLLRRAWRLPVATRNRCNASRPGKSTSSPDRRLDAQFIALERQLANLIGSVSRNVVPQRLTRLQANVFRIDRALEVVDVVEGRVVRMVVRACHINRVVGLPNRARVHKARQARASLTLA